MSLKTYPHLLGTFDGERKDFTASAYEESKDGRCYMKADGDIDVDGLGPSHGDPYYQPDTTLHLHGKALNSDKECFIVLPPKCLTGVGPVVLGCQAQVTWKGRKFPAVVGDVGPTRKVGELSYLLAQLLHMNPSPINGGVDFAEVLYEWWPGLPAVVNGVTYSLQPFRG